MENKITHYYWESDFKLIDTNVQAGVPFAFKYYIKNDGASVEVGYDGSTYTNCRPSEEVEGAIVVPFDNFGGKLGIGTLKVKRVYDIVDADMADGVFNSVTEQVLPIELWRGPSDDVSGDAVIVYDSLYRGAPGKSAYQTWLDIGNVGSEQDFIDSLGVGGSVTIVNNLTEGGINKALSAEMGKELAERGRAMTETILGYGESIGYIADVMATKEDLSEYAKSADMITAEPAEGDSEEVEDYVLMKSDIEHIISHVVEQTDSVATIQPNVLNVWGEIASLDITLAEPTDNNIVNEYMAQFTSGATATTLTLPSTIKWMAAPNIQPNKTYQLSIVNNLGVIGEFSHE